MNNGELQSSRAGTEALRHCTLSPSLQHHEPTRLQLLVRLYANVLMLFSAILLSLSALHPTSSHTVSSSQPASTSTTPETQVASLNLEASGHLILQYTHRNIWPASALFISVAFTVYHLNRHHHHRDQCLALSMLAAAITGLTLGLDLLHILLQTQPLGIAAGLCLSSVFHYFLRLQRPPRGQCGDPKYSDDTSLYDNEKGTHLLDSPSFPPTTPRSCSPSSNAWRCGLKDSTGSQAFELHSDCVSYSITPVPSSATVDVAVATDAQVMFLKGDAGPACTRRDS